MAFLARRAGVRADQRETRRVVVEAQRAEIRGGGRVAVRATVPAAGGELPRVRIDVAVEATAARGVAEAAAEGVGLARGHVAGLAGRARVFAEQFEAGPQRVLEDFAVVLGEGGRRVAARAVLPPLDARERWALECAGVRVGMAGGAAFDGPGETLRHPTEGAAEFVGDLRARVANLAGRHGVGALEREAGPQRMLEVRAEHVAEGRRHVAGGAILGARVRGEAALVRIDVAIGTGARRAVEDARTGALERHSMTVGAGGAKVGAHERKTRRRVLIQTEIRWGEVRAGVASEAVLGGLRREEGAGFELAPVGIGVAGGAVLRGTAGKTRRVGGVEGSRANFAQGRAGLLRRGGSVACVALAAGEGVVGWIEGETRQGVQLGREARTLGLESTGERVVAGAAGRAGG